MATKFSLKQGETRTSHGPIPHPLRVNFGLIQIAPIELQFDCKINKSLRQSKHFTGILLSFNVIKGSWGHFRYAPYFRYRVGTCASLSYSSAPLPVWICFNTSQFPLKIGTIRPRKNEFSSMQIIAARMLIGLEYVSQVCLSWHSIINWVSS